MLISFSVGNFRSFGEEQTLNMTSSKRFSDHPGHLIRIGTADKFVLRTALLYGANAAGKSNLIRAMAFAQKAIIEPRGRGPISEPFRFGSDKDRKPSSFEFRFLIEDHVFVYGFDINGRKIDSEWLFVCKGDDELCIFERDDKGNTKLGTTYQNFLDHDRILVKTLKALISLPLRLDQLFLSRACGLPEEVQGIILGAVIRWLTKELVILNASHRSFDILDRLHRNPEFLRFSGEFLRNVGTGVGELKLEEDERDAEDWERKYLPLYGPDQRPPFYQEDRDIRQKNDDPSRVIDRRLLAVHERGGDHAFLPFSEESDGTQQLLHLMPVLASPGQGGKVVVLDELDRSLHPLICWEFIRFFSESCPGTHKQLIVTTHEAHLLNQDLLRRDEYWFVEKDVQQQSQLVPLSGFSIRNDLQVAKGYLNGRFGAIPMIGPMDSLEKLLSEGLNSEVHNAP